MIQSIASLNFSVTDLICNKCICIVGEITVRKRLVDVTAVLTKVAE